MLRRTYEYDNDNTFSRRDRSRNHDQGLRSRVFEALVDPAQRMKWWGQKGRFETTNVESDLRPGGRWLMSGTGMGRPFQSRRRLSDHQTSARTRLHLAAVLGRRWDRGTGAVRFG